MLSLRFTVDTKRLELVRSNLHEFRRRVFNAYELQSRPLRGRLLRDLKTEPGSPKYPLHWKNRRQKRKVLMLLREQGNLPYTRTHELIRQWTVKMQSNLVGGRLEIENDSPVVRYVQGEWQQPFHKDTGWPNETLISVRYTFEATRLLDSVIDQQLEAL